MNAKKLNILFPPNHYLHTLHIDIDFLRIPFEILQQITPRIQNIKKLSLSDCVSTWYNTTHRNYFFSSLSLEHLVSYLCFNSMPLEELNCIFSNSKNVSKLEIYGAAHGQKLSIKKYSFYVKIFALSITLNVIFP